MSRIIQWKVRDAQVTEAPLEGVMDGHPQNCDNATAQVYAGFGKTGGNALWALSLPAISCLNPAPGGDRRLSFVATATMESADPAAARPLFLVSQTVGSTIIVTSYSPNGRASDVEFAWHCIVEGTLVQGQ